MGNITETIYCKLPIAGQNILISLYGFKITLQRYGKEFDRISNFLKESQFFSEAEIIEYQRENLVKIISHAYYNVPYYREIFDKRKLTPRDIRNVNDLHKLPILTKKDIKDNFKKLIATGLSGKKLIHGHTSGTTGTPLDILWDKNTVLITNALLWRQRNWAGLNFGERFSTFFGRVSVPISQKKPPYWRYNFAHKQVLFSSFHLTRENLKYYFDKLTTYKPVAIEGYPSNIFILAKYLEYLDQKFPVRSILTTSETLHQYQREVIEDRFCCKIYDYYGMAERVVFATECEMHKGHHLNSEYGITEIVNSDGMASGVDQLGRIVATGLHNYGMPLIRYATNDVSLLRKDKCTCGRTLPLLADVTTKAEDIITTRDGRYISSSALTHPFKPLDNIEESQIIQDDINGIRIKIVKKAGYSDHDTKHLINEMQMRLGNDMNIKIEFVDEITRGSNDKFRWVISNVPLRF